MQTIEQIRDRLDGATTLTIEQMPKLDHVPFIKTCIAARHVAAMRALDELAAAQAVAECPEIEAMIVAMVERHAIDIETISSMPIKLLKQQAKVSRRL